jgi:hypothetical protein
MLLMYYRTAWNDYFSTTNPTNLNSQTYTSRQNPSDSSVYVSNCLFDSITLTSKGGALYCTSVTYLLVESTSFFSCKTSGGYGGAIYFSNTNNGQSVLHEVCGYDCCSTSSTDHQFAYIQVNNAASSKNYANYSSFTRCVTVNSESEYTLSLFNGKISCPFVNSSLNKCKCVSGLYCCPLSDSNCVTCSILYSSIADNIDTGWICIYLERSAANYEIKNCNILRNTQFSYNTCGTIWTYGDTMIANSCILENKANYVFYAVSYTITLFNCTFDNATFYGNYKTTNTVTKSFILALKHMSTRNCHAQYDSAGTLTPIAPPLSSSNKNKLYYSCQRLLQGSFVSLSSLLIILFIHPGASRDL